MGKSINKKETRKLIIERRENGLSDQKIYNELSPEYYDKKGLAFLIMSTIKVENVKKYRLLNDLLRLLIGLTILFKIFSIINLSFDSESFGLLFLVLIVPIVNVYFLYVVSTFDVANYKSCAFITLIGITQLVSNFDKLSAIDIISSLILLSSIAGLFFYLYNILIPDYSLTKFSKDKNGEYILLDDNSETKKCKYCEKSSIIRDETVTKCQWCEMKFDY